MEELFDLGLSETDLKNMLETNPSIIEISKEEIKTYISFLKNIGCEDRHIRNILIANPFYLNRSITELVGLVNALSKLGLTYLNLLFDSNPFLLNKDDFEIEEFVNNKLNSGMDIEDICDLLDSNPYIIDEE